MNRLDFPDRGACPKCGSENTFFQYQQDDFLKFKCGRCAFNAEMKTKEQTDREQEERDRIEKQKRLEEKIKSKTKENP